jgi:hypothetical protein
MLSQDPAPDGESVARADQERGPGDGSGEGPLVEGLIGDLPEFIPIYRDLVDQFDDDPGEPAVLMELADFVADRLGALAKERLVVERALDVVEALLDSMADDVIGCELVGFAFFDSLSIEHRRCLVPWLGPRSRSLIDALDVSFLE